MDRWTYALQRLQALRSTWDYANKFDLVLYGRFGAGKYEVVARNQQTGAYESLAIIDSNIRPNYANPEITAIRFLDQTRYLAEGKRLELQIKALDPVFSGYLERAYIAKTEPYQIFRTSESLKADSSASVPDYAVAYDNGRRILSGSPEFDLCVYK